MSHDQRSSKEENWMPTGLSSSINTQRIHTVGHSTILLVTVTFDNVSSMVQSSTI
jgi:hypothetical protein